MKMNKYIEKAAIIITMAAAIVGLHNMNVTAANIDTEKPYTIQDYIAYMQHSYTEYNIFFENADKPETMFTTDEEYYEYRQIDTDTINVTGKIAVVCGINDDESDSEDIEDEDETNENENDGADSNDTRISSAIKENEEDYIKRIYKGSHLPEKILLDYISADQLTRSNEKKYDMYIFEISSRDANISEETFLLLDTMLKKENVTMVYDGKMVIDTHGTGEHDGSEITIIETPGEKEYTLLITGESKRSSDKGLYLIGMDNNGTKNKVIYNNSPKYKDCKQEDIESKEHGWIWMSYLQDEQRTSYGILLYHPYTTIKILPTCKGDNITDAMSLFGKNHDIFRYIQHIVLPSSITAIPDNTFSDYDVLEDINLNYITTFGKQAFLNCKSLQDICFSTENDITIGDSAFMGCGLVDIKIPSTVKRIEGSFAFGSNYITPYESLQNHVTTYQTYIDYTTYFKNHPEEETEKIPSVQSVTITVSDNGLSLGENTFTLTAECDNVSVHYENETDLSLFAFTDKNGETWEDFELSPEKLNTVINIKYLRPVHDTSSEAPADLSPTDHPKSGAIEKPTTPNGVAVDVNDDPNVHSVTLIDTQYTIPKEGKIIVENGMLWRDYLIAYESKNSIGSFYKLDILYNFTGWHSEDGTNINYNETIALDTNIILYTNYTLSGNGLNKTLKLTFYSDNGNKTINVKIGTKLSDYDIPTPIRATNRFIGWTTEYPIQSTNEIISNDAIINYNLFKDNGDPQKILYPVFQADTIDKRSITTNETLCGEHIYRLNKNNIGQLNNYDKSDITYTLDQSAFNKTDITNAEIIKNKILKANKNKVAILPKGYTVDVEKLQKKGYTVIKTNLELSDYISALTYINCRYFQYLQLIQTPYFKTETELNNWDKTKDPVNYSLKVSDFALDAPSYSKGFIYFVNRDTFTEYYNICNEMETKVINIGNSIGLHKGMTITDALWRIDELSINNYAYDFWYHIYDLNWFLRVTDKNRNTEQTADYHGVCASYTKLAFALLGLYGYEAIPTAVGDGTNANHSISKVVINGNIYYCDYTWDSQTQSSRYMFMTTNNLIFRSHKNPQSDDMGSAINYSRTTSSLSSLKIKSIKNVKGKKMTVNFNQVKNSDGYELQYSNSRKFKSAKTKKISKTKITIKKLKKNKTYYVRVRPYKNVKLHKTNGQYQTIKYYGSWSKAKKIKIKK